MLETGVGRAANLALAALPGFTLPGDLSATDRYYRRDVTAPFVLDAATGTMAVPVGPGIGVEVDGDALEALAVSCDTVRPAR
jgi:O-succinylbenzoate synthase